MMKIIKFLLKSHFFVDLTCLLTTASDGLRFSLVTAYNFMTCTVSRSTSTTLVWNCCLFNRISACIRHSMTCCLLLIRATLSV
ncbi:hypothetical protein L596_025500 [Steinernema carpocapsae]|uniref:Secreted protein n=1 Tax=Steinernema carpocapsae TaxID=34508 RepID=A0A4U5M7Y6_STECR|nr:hypothetical protein L596_025500 [Steinernema carpocapsae]